MPILNLRLTQEQAAFIDSKAHGYVKKVDVVRHLIDQAMRQQSDPKPSPLAYAVAPVSILGKGGRGDGAYSSASNSPLPLNSSSFTPISNRTNPYTEMGSLRGRVEPDETTTGIPSELVPAKAPKGIKATHPVPMPEAFWPSAEDVPEELKDATENLLGFWEAKGGGRSKQAWKVLCFHCRKILNDKRGGMDILQGELDAASQRGQQSLSFTHWMAYGVKTDSGTFQGRRGASEPDMSNHPAYKPFPGFGD